MVELSLGQCRKSSHVRGQWSYLEIKNIFILKGECTKSCTVKSVWPVVCTVRLLANCRVLLVPDQPVKLGVAPKTQGPKTFDGDVAAASVEVSQDHHILDGCKRVELPINSLRGESIKQSSLMCNQHQFSTSCEFPWRRCRAGRSPSWRALDRCAALSGQNPSPL